MKKIVVVGLLGCVFFAVIAGVNHFSLNKYAHEAMEFRDVDAMAYYRYGVIPNSIVLDIRSVGPESSGAGTIGGLIEFADKLSDREFQEVTLAWRGEARFMLDGKDFSTIGREAPFQNPVYTIRTLPEKLTTPDGLEAFSTWTGGALGVLNAQMEDVNSFVADWYLDDAIGRY